MLMYGGFNIYDVSLVCQHGSICYLATNILSTAKADGNVSSFAGGLFIIQSAEMEILT